MIPGDGIGPELMLHVKSVFRYGGPGLFFPYLLSQEVLYPRPISKHQELCAKKHREPRNPPSGTFACKARSCIPMFLILLD